jgi:hypothetical protein
MATGASASGCCSGHTALERGHGGQRSGHQLCPLILFQAITAVGCGQHQLVGFSVISDYIPGPTARPGPQPVEPGPTAGQRPGCAPGRHGGGSQLALPFFIIAAPASSLPALPLYPRTPARPKRTGTVPPLCPAAAPTTTVSSSRTYGNCCAIPATAGCCGNPSSFPWPLALPSGFRAGPLLAFRPKATGWKRPPSWATSLLFFQCRGVVGYSGRLPGRQMAAALCSRPSQYGCDRHARLHSLPCPALLFAAA